jgi:hypothetical protein
MSGFSARLRTRLVVIELLAVVPAAAAIVYIQTKVRRQARERTVAESQRLVRLAASQQAAVFEGARRLLLTLAEFPGLQSDDPAACNAVLPKILHDHTDKAIADQGLLGAERILLSKPFTPDALERAIRQALDRPTQVAP